jgi:hypothetical protein
MRQPVIANALLKPLTVSVRSATSGTDPDREVGVLAVDDLLVDLVGQDDKVRRDVAAISATTAASARRSASEYIVPHGLLGLLITSSRLLRGDRVAQLVGRDLEVGLGPGCRSPGRPPAGQLAIGR